MENVTINALLFLIACHVFILLVLLWLLIRFLRRFWNGKINFRTEKVLALGIVCLFYGKLINAAITGPATRFYINFQTLFFTLYDYSLSNSFASSNEMSIKRPVGESLVRFDDLISGFPLSDLILAFALVLLTYRLLKLLRPEVLSIHSKKEKMPANHKRMLIFNFFIGVTLLISLYFVISVFVSIPYLNEMRKPSGFTKTLLDSTLNGVSKAAKLLKNYDASLMPGNIALDSLLINEEQKSDFNKLPEKTKIGIVSDLKLVNDDYQRVISTRLKLLDVVNTLVKEDQTSRQNAIFKSGTTFETNSANIAIDKANLYRDLVSNFDGFLRAQQQNYNYLINLIKQGDALNKSFYTIEYQRLKERINVAVKDSVPQQRADNLFLKRDYFTPYYDVSAINYDWQVSFKIPERDGSDWGLLGNMSGFLIKTKSQELILLIGMIGFGILGASILSFVPTNDFFRSCTQEPVIKNFPNVLARGFGAALIIYLATKGGLAIFSGGTNADPNGYILLLTCFVGAVYSEKVWAKVSVSLLSDPQKPANVPATKTAANTIAELKKNQGRQSKVKPPVTKTP